MLIQLAPNLFNNQAHITYMHIYCNALITKLEWAWDQEIMSKPYCKEDFLTKSMKPGIEKLMLLLIPTAEPLIKFFFFCWVTGCTYFLTIGGLGPQKPIHVGISDSELGPVWTD